MWVSNEYLQNLQTHKPVGGSVPHPSTKPPPPPSMGPPKPPHTGAQYGTMPTPATRTQSFNQGAQQRMQQMSHSRWVCFTCSRPDRSEPVSVIA